MTAQGTPGFESLSISVVQAAKASRERARHCARVVCNEMSRTNLCSRNMLFPCTFCAHFGFVSRTDGFSVAHIVPRGVPLSVAQAG